MSLTTSLPSLLARRALLSLGLLASLTPFAHAQQEEEPVSVSFYALSWQGSIQDLLYFDGGKPVSLFIPNGAPGHELTYRGSPEMGFYTQRTGPEGEILYDLQTSVTIPRNVKRLLLVFLPSTSGAQQAYKILALPDAGSGFTANAFNFYNLTGAAMAIRVGDEKFQVAPGRNHIVSLADVDTKNVDVQMASNARNSEWNMIYQSRWASPKQRRAWVFIYGEAGATPSIRKYYQVVQKRETAPRGIPGT